MQAVRALYYIFITLFFVRELNVIRKVEMEHKYIGNAYIFVITIQGQTLRNNLPRTYGIN